MSGANLEWVEQIWSGCSKFGVGKADLDRTVWRVADNLKKTLLCKYFRGQIYTYICWFSCETSYRAMKVMTDT